MKSPVKGNLVYLVIILIGTLLVTDIILTYHNNRIMKQDKEVQLETQRLKIYYDQIGKLVIHAYDLGLRGYAISKDERLALPLYNAHNWKDSILSNVEEPLRKQKFDMSSFDALKDSLQSYDSYCFYLKSLIDQGKYEEFKKIFKADRGAVLWHEYLICEEEIKSFATKIDAEAEARYEQALAKNHLLQIIIFLISVPTLLFTAYYTSKTFDLSELLRKAQIEKNKILQEQNVKLELAVAVRAGEILSQHKEISLQAEELAAQRDTLAAQNQQLQEAHNTIELKNIEINEKNLTLEREVEHRTEELRFANQQLIEHNNQLEQFSFITAHNLRAPLARILGLANVLEITKDVEERESLLTMLVSSTRDLDQVIKDLNVILEIKKQTGNLSRVDLDLVFERVVKILEKEREETGAILLKELDEAYEVEAIGPYVESIIYNLISNAIKYRHPDRQPLIKVSTRKVNDFICLVVSDNGLGIDLQKHKHNLFNLYRRFHFHMEGKGLGLHLVKTQIMALGGKIEVESEPDQGTTFYIYFKS